MRDWFVVFLLALTRSTQKPVTSAGKLKRLDSVHMGLEMFFPEATQGDSAWTIDIRSLTCGCLGGMNLDVFCASQRFLRRLRAEDRLEIGCLFGMSHRVLFCLLVWKDESKSSVKSVCAIFHQLTLESESYNAQVFRKWIGWILSDLYCTVVTAVMTYTPLNTDVNHSFVYRLLFGSHQCSVSGVWGCLPCLTGFLSDEISHYYSWLLFGHIKLI